MEIYFGNLPAEATAYDLRMLLNQAMEELRRGFLFFSYQPQPRHFDIQIVEKQDNDKVYRYGHAIIEPDSIATHCIMALTGQTLQGRTLHVREYYQRVYMNERRALDWRSQPYHGPERRGKERRRRTSLLAAAA